MSERARSARKWILMLLAGAIVVSLAAVAWVKLVPRRVPSGQPPLATLSADSLPAFRAAFNSADGEIRVLALLSPT